MVRDVFKYIGELLEEDGVVAGELLEEDGVIASELKDEPDGSLGNSGLFGIGINKNIRYVEEGLLILGKFSHFLVVSQELAFLWTVRDLFIKIL